MKRTLAICACACYATTAGAQNTAYVVDNGGGRVNVISLANQNVAAVIPAGAQAAEMLVLNGNRTAFVSNQGDNNVAVLDLSTNARVATIPTGDGPGSLSATPDGRFVYVANETSNDVTVIDVNARTVVKTIAVGATPVQVNMAPSGRYAYVVNKDDAPAGTISVIDTNRNLVLKTVPVGASPNQFAILPGLNTAYVVNSGSGSLSLWDLTRNEVTGQVAIGARPATVAFSSDSSRLYVTNRGSNNVSVVDTRQNREIARIPTGTEPVAMAVTFDSNFGFVSNIGSGSVSLLDLSANSRELDIAVGSQPFSLALDPNEDFLFVTNLGSGTVSVVDLNTDRVSRTIQTGGVPVQFALLNAPTLLELAPRPAQNGAPMMLNGEAFLPGSQVRFTTAAPPRVLTPAVTFLDSQGLRVNVPNFQGNAVVDVLNPDGNSSERITFQSGASAPAILAGGVVEAAGFTRAPAPISGNGIVSIFGTFPGLADTGSGSLPLPTSLGNARVTFNGVPAGLFATSGAAGLINAHAPVRLLAYDSVRVAVTIGNQTSAVETVKVAPTSPGIFVIPVDGMAAALHGSDPAQRITPANPARRGELIVMFVAGLGNTEPGPVDGEAAPTDVLSPATAPIAVEVGGAAAREIVFAGLTPGSTGLYQINFAVPVAAPVGGAIPVVIRAGGPDTTSAVVQAKLAVE